MKYSKSAETTWGICVFCSKLLEAAQKKEKVKKKGTAFPRKQFLKEYEYGLFCIYISLEKQHKEKSPISDQW